MLLIFSSVNDTSTNQVIDWLKYFGMKFKRVNDKDRFTVSSFILTNNVFVCELTNESNGEILDIAKISSVWYRRGNIVFLEKSSLSNDFGGILSFAKKEFEILHDFIFDYLEKLPRLDSYFRSSMNKLIVLSLAKSVGLLIPNTYIFQDRFPSSLYGEYITKSVFELYKYESTDGWYFSPTSLIDSKEIKKKGFSYSISKIQEHIEKECDIRVFYLRGKLFSMAIMSQKNDKSKIDFRN